MKSHSKTIKQTKLQSKPKPTIIFQCETYKEVGWARFVDNIVYDEDHEFDGYNGDHLIESIRVHGSKHELRYISGDYLYEVH